MTEKRPQTKTTKNKIKSHWYAKLKKMGKISSISKDEFLQKDVCFACLRRDLHLERAHIVSYMDGGEDNPKNLHLLCKACHRQSEIYTGEVYWRWFMNQHAMISFLYDMTRYSGISTQKIFDIFIRSALEEMFNKIGIELNTDNHEQTAKWLSDMKGISSIIQRNIGEDEFAKFYYQ